MVLVKLSKYRHMNLYMVCFENKVPWFYPRAGWNSRVYICDKCSPWKNYMAKICGGHTNFDSKQLTIVWIPIEGSWWKTTGNFTPDDSHCNTGEISLILKKEKRNLQKTEKKIQNQIDVHFSQRKEGKNRKKKERKKNKMK